MTPQNQFPVAESRPEPTAPYEVLAFRRQQVVETIGRIAHEQDLLGRAYIFNLSRLMAINELMRGIEPQD